MPKVDVYNIKGDVVGNVELSDSVFGVKVNNEVIHASVVNILANKRQGTQSTKTKSEVRGGGRKPWKQKGTGRARQGSIRSAQWIKGGIVLGPKPRSYSYALPKKVRRLALKSALTSKVIENQIMVIDKLELQAIKTKNMVEILNNLKAHNALLVIGSNDEKIVKSAKNIPGIHTALVNTINVYDILKYDKFLITQEAVTQVEEVYAE